jgi:hypothetical protein
MLRYHSLTEQLVDEARKTRKTKDLVASVFGNQEKLFEDSLKAARLQLLNPHEQFGLQMAKLAREQQSYPGTVMVQTLENARMASKGGLAAELESAANLYKFAIAQASPEIARIRQIFEQATRPGADAARYWQDNIPPQVPAIEPPRVDFSLSPAIQAWATAVNLPTFDRTFLGELHEIVRQLQETEEGLEGAIGQLRTRLTDKADSLGHTWPNYKGMWDLLYPLMLFLLSLLSSNSSEKRARGELHGFVNEVSAEIEKLKPSGQSQHLLVVERQCHLRADRFPKSPIIGVLFPNQLITLDRTSGKWAYVHFFDYIEALPRAGWVMKKYLGSVGKSSGGLSQ